jgi:hypothetical protein
MVSEVLETFCSLYSPVNENATRTSGLSETLNRPRKKWHPLYSFSYTARSLFAEASGSGSAAAAIASAAPPLPLPEEF